jgi:Ca2+-binding RTX toxin-like protein
VSPSSGVFQSLLFSKQGTDLADFLQADDDNNWLLEGLKDDDTIVGQGGDDTLKGGGGNDTMIGGEGNDTYYVNRIGDNIFEYADEGIDTVRLAGWDSGAALTDYYLHDHVENVIAQENFTGFRIHGNELDNEIVANPSLHALIGHEGDDTVDAGAGNDWLYGSEGNDTLIGGNGDDTVDGGVGADWILGSGGIQLANEFDLLVGGETSPGTGGDGAQDTFILGEARITYYGSGVGALDGYAIIREFENGLDVFQLSGSASDYNIIFEDFAVRTLGAASGTANGITDAVIYHAATSNVIAVVEDFSSQISVNSLVYV